MSDRLGNSIAWHGGIGVRHGCHCAHMLIKDLLHISFFLQQVQNLVIGLFPKLYPPGLVRISFGLQNTTDDVDTLIQTLKYIADNRPAKRVFAAVDQQLRSAALTAETAVFASA